MRIIFRYLLKSIWEKKLRTFLIILSIVLSTGVFFASMAISGSLTDMITNTIRGYCGSSDIIIMRNNKSATPFLYTQTFKKHKEMFEYIAGQIDAGGIYITGKQEEVEVSIHGVSIDELEKMNPFKLVEEKDIYPFEGNKIIIDDMTAKSYGLKTGDWMELSLQGNKKKFSICGIATASGPFTRMGAQIQAVVPVNYIAAMSNSMGKVTVAYVKLKQGYGVQETIEQLSKEYKNYIFLEAIPLSEIESEMSMISLVFLALSSIVFFMSIFIIYSSFKVITIERLPAIGTFRSIGATRKMTDFILLGESFLYGIIGGIAGVLSGVGMLYGFAYIFSNLLNSWNEASFDMAVNFSLQGMITALLLAVVLCFVSSIVPITKVSRIPVKDVILNTISKPVKYKNIRLIIGIILMGLSLTTIFQKDDDLRPLFGGGGMILSLVAIIVLVPYFTALFAKAFERLYVFIFGNIGMLAAKNLRENKSILNNISMLAIGISSLLFINTVGYNSVLSVMDMYKNSNFDVEMYLYTNSLNTERIIRNISGVAYVYPDYAYYGIEIKGKDEKVSIKSTDINNFERFWDIKMEDGQNVSEVLIKLNNERNIIVTSALKEKLGLENGDVIQMKMNSGIKSYKVIGFFNEILGSKQWALAAERFLINDMQDKYADHYFIQGSVDQEIVAENLKNSFRRYSPYIRSRDKIIEENITGNQQVVMFMQIFSILALIIGVFGVINNLIISFIERKHSIAIFRSVGMSRKQILTMILIEALTGGIIGGILGVMGSIIMITVMIGISEDMEVAYPVSSFITYVLAGSFVMIATSMGPAMKSSKIDLAASLKYE
jgi:putative ABC transport system permease protein